jgi:hypothetical protein
LGADDGTTIDVLVLYTPAARMAAGSIPAIRAVVDLAVAETNASYGNSGIVQRLRLVHTAEVNYSEVGGDFKTDLTRLSGTTDGYMDEVHALRNTHGADLVALIIDDSSLCGRANLMNTVSSQFHAFAFSVT